jgi:ferric enterobactin receptor
MKLKLLLLIFCLSANLQAQTITTALNSVKGIAVDSLTKETLDYITIGLKTEQNIPIKSTLSNSDGTFTISDIKAGNYLLTLISVGYQTKTIKLKLDEAPATTDLGTIHLSTKNNQLKEVIVLADKPIIKQEIDLISYDLQADPESKTSNVMEIMRKVPLISVDGDDNILLKGDANYKILINGKPSSMMERNAKEILKSMPASSIQNIEVITNPPAKYDAEGIAGIINIITNKKLDNGYNGSINMSQRFPAGGPGTGGSATFKQGKLGISAFGGANISRTPLISNTISRTSSGIINTNLSQIISRKTDSRNGYFGSELSFEIDSLNLISGQLNINGNSNENRNYQQSLLKGQTAVLQSYNLDGNNEGNGHGMDAALNYQLGFKKNKQQLLTFSYRIYAYRNEQNNELISSNPFNYNIPDYNQFNNGGTMEQTMQIDYIQPVKKMTIEAGIKGIRRKNDSDFRFKYFDENSGQYETDAARTNIFDNTQQVLGAYNTYQYNFKNWGLKGGFRLERTVIDADFISGQKQVRQEYLNLIPSFSLNRKFNDMSNLNLGFSQRIQRPGIYQLNPFVDRSNPNFESTGNPDLHPTTGSNLSLSYSKSKKGSFNFLLGYQAIKGMIMPVYVFDPISFITYNSYDNTGRARLFQANLNLNYPFTKKLNFSFNGGVSHGRVQGIVNSILVKNEGFMYNFSLSGSYRFEKGWRLNASVNASGPNISLQGTSNSYIGSSFSINKDLIKDKLSFSAAANNPFRKYRTNIRESFGPDFLQTSNFQTFYRSFNTSLNYRFGKLKSTIKKNTRGIKNDDVSNNSGQ